MPKSAFWAKFAVLGGPYTATRRKLGSLRSTQAAGATEAPGTSTVARVQGSKVLDFGEKCQNRRFEAEIIVLGGLYAATRCVLGLFWSA